VRDANREKMSKTKGNVVDPIEIVKQYGTDAVRFTLASMASPGTDIAFNIARTEGYRAFANKIWNAARFIFMNVDRAAEVGITVDRNALGAMPTVPADAPLEARWIVAELHATAAKVNNSLEDYRFDDAANTIYQFFWGSFCDWYLEIVKLRLDFSEAADKAKTQSALTTLVQVFEVALRLLSPFMPFLTEELWHAVYDGNPPAKSIALTRYPQGSYIDGGIGMQNIQEVVPAIRARRKDLHVPEKEVVPAKIAADAPILRILEKDPEIIRRLAKVDPLELIALEVRNRDDKYAKLAWQPLGRTEICVEFETKVDIAAEREKLAKEIAKQEKIIANGERQLNNPGFTDKAPAHIVEGLNKQLDEARRLLDKLRRDLDGLSG
jgi:valyl-tRNA synthetase